MKHLNNKGCNPKMNLTNKHDTKNGLGFGQVQRIKNE
jgi:hypothetical protein